FAAALSVLVASVLVVVAVTPAQQTPIKIGFTTDLTGTAAQAAKDMVNGFTMYLDEVGGQMAGRKVELIVEDTQGRPDVALTKLRKLVEHDRVHLVAGVLTMIGGASTIQFMKQYEEAGLKGKIPLIAGGPAVDEALLPSMGDEAIGVISPLIYSGALDTLANRRFAREYRAKFGKVPSYFAETNYTSGRWINEAVRSLAGNVEDREKMLAALRKVEIPDAPRGPVKLDGHGNPIQNVYFRKVERNREGELQNTVIVTIPAVSHFWKYNPEEFLKQPVYSR